jgi:putative transcriptional regulator
MTRQKSLLDTTLDLAQDLHRVGAMDKATLRRIADLAVPDVPSFSPAEIRLIRENNRVSQPVFARYLNVGASTVAQWEQGKKRPGGSSARLLDVIHRKGLHALT